MNETSEFYLNKEVNIDKIVDGIDKRIREVELEATRVTYSSLQWRNILNQAESLADMYSSLTPETNDGLAEKKRVDLISQIEELKSTISTISLFKDPELTIDIMERNYVCRAKMMDINFDTKLFDKKMRYWSGVDTVMLTIESLDEESLLSVVDQVLRAIEMKESDVIDQLTN